MSSKYWNHQASSFNSFSHNEETINLDLADKIILKVDAWNEGVHKGIFDLSCHTYEAFILIDISDHILKLARKSYLKINFVQADIRSLPFKTGVFNSILDISTSDHLPFFNVDSILREYQRLLRKGGELLLIFNKQNLIGKIIITIRKLLKFYLPSYKIEPSYWFNVNKIKATLKPFFKILEADDFGSELLSTFKKPSFIPRHIFFMSYQIRCIRT